MTEYYATLLADKIDIHPSQTEALEGKDTPV